MLKISEKDNVAVITNGEKRGHKLALTDIKKGEKIIKYGYPIGCATQDIKEGEWVHSHNMKTALGDIIDYTYTPEEAKVFSTQKDTFMGYERFDGSVGIRNEIWIIATVGCVSDNAKKIAALTDTYAFTHPYGCSQLGDDHLNTQKALCGLIKHPNAGGVLVLGLGCENNRIQELKKELGQYDTERVFFLEAQSVEDEIEEGVKIVNKLKELIKKDVRTKQPLEKLIIGLKCGGSDGFSGITANPLVGAFSDMVIEKGASTILTEVPEMFGAETILMNRCNSKEIFDKTVDMINSFKNYYKSNNQPIYENPSPGNKDGGITTLEEKSLGCTQKSGFAPVVDVLSYAQPLKIRGLNLLNAPGNDLVASTALAVSGAQIVLFTTGRGTPFGCPVPTVKISTNTPLFDKKSNWIDYNAGVLLDNPDINTLAEDFYSFIKNIVNGEQKAKNEINGYREISIFKTGVTL
ncbi:MAG: altronate dehydratase [Ruminococcaceae bacterium]|nr:altronate dehydratase [Oscillospiraceae bacterium]